MVTLVNFFGSYRRGRIQGLLVFEQHFSVLHEVAEQGVRTHFLHNVADPYASYRSAGILELTQSSHRLQVDIFVSEWLLRRMYGFSQTPLTIVHFPTVTMKMAASEKTGNAFIVPAAVTSYRISYMSPVLRQNPSTLY